MAIGDRIRCARKRAGLNQRELASAIGVSPGLVGAWETHIKVPGRETLKRLAEATLTDVNSILSEVAPTLEGVKIVDPKEISLLLRFRRMSDPQQDNLLELLGVSADVAREMKKKREPAKL